jgi:flavin-dependent dehydrogenase
VVNGVTAQVTVEGEGSVENFDVVIVGSGPAGAACGKALKEKGIRVLIVEKENLPRHKVCTALVLGQAQELILQYFGEAPPSEVQSAPGMVKATNVQLWHKETGFSPFTLELPKEGRVFPQEFLNVWRHKFDYWLLKKSGAEFRDGCEFRGWSEENGKYKVRLAGTSGAEREVICSYLVAADGGESRIRASLDSSGADETGPVVAAYQALYQVKDMGKLAWGHCHIFLEREFGDIMALVHCKDEFLELAVAGLKGRNLRECEAKLKDFLQEQFQVVFGELARAKGCSGKMRPPYLGKDRVLLTGDAAGILYHSGEGIGPAIDSGYKAGSAIYRSMKEGKNALEEYKNEAKSMLEHMKVCLDHQNFMVH